MNRHLMKRNRLPELRNPSLREKLKAIRNSTVYWEHCAYLANYRADKFKSELERANNEIERLKKELGKWQR